MLGFGATGQFAIGQVGQANVEFLGPDKWMMPLSEPKRFRQGLAAPDQAFLALHPTPIVSFGWYGALTEPVRQKPRSPAALSPTFFMQPAPSPFVATGWYTPLSEPVRLPKGLKVYLQRFDTQDTKFTPAVTTLLQGWYTPLSEPKRFRKGLGAHLQQSYTAHPRVLPKPNVTVIINTTEIDRDQVSVAINVVRSNPPVSARVSIVEVGSGLSPTAVIESS